MSLDEQETPIVLKYFEAAAAALAVACNGGEWATHYTDDQKRLWRRRLKAALLLDF